MFNLNYNIKIKNNLKKSKLILLKNLPCIDLYMYTKRSIERCSRLTLPEIAPDRQEKKKSWKTLNILTED